ncbi:MAG: hypothetical protein AAB436_03590 [Patescibacteria group bacterium]
MATEYTDYDYSRSEAGFMTAVYKIEPPLPSISDTFLTSVVEGGHKHQRLNHLATTGDATYLVYEPLGKNQDEQMTGVVAIRAMLDKALQQLSIGSTEGLVDMVHNEHVAYDESRAGSVVTRVL